MITEKKNNKDLARLSDNKLMHDFAKEKYFDVKPQGKKSTQDRTPMKLLKSPGLKTSAACISKKIVFNIWSKRNMWQKKSKAPRKLSGKQFWYI